MQSHKADSCKSRFKARNSNTTTQSIIIDGGPAEATCYVGVCYPHIEYRKGPINLLLKKSERINLLCKKAHIFWNPPTRWAASHTRCHGRGGIPYRGIVLGKCWAGFMLWPNRTRAAWVHDLYRASKFET